MFDFIAERLGFWAIIVMWSLIGLGVTLGLLFTKLEKKLHKELTARIVTLFTVTGIIGWVLFLVALTITAWPS